jgi:hypothetical protein
MIYPLRVAASEIVILNTGDEKEKASPTASWSQL